MTRVNAVKTRLGSGGFTIIELLITIAVVGIILPTMMAFVNELNRLNDRTKDLALINSMAENKVESLRSAGYSGVPEGTVDFTNELPESIAGPKSAEYIASTPNPGIRQVDMTIQYNDHGFNQTIRYKTLIGELGVGQY